MQIVKRRCVADMHEPPLIGKVPMERVINVTTVDHRARWGQFNVNSIGEKWLHVYSPRNNMTPEMIQVPADRLFLVEPYDPGAANVFADWLEEQGFHTAAQALRHEFPLSECK